MKCKHCGKDIPDQEVRKHVYSLMGKASGKSKARSPEKARKAGLARWGLEDPEERNGK